MALALSEAIKAHREARAAYVATLSVSDEDWRRERGLDVSEDVMEAMESASIEAGGDEAAAWLALIQVEPSTCAELAVKVRYITASPSLDENQDRAGCSAAEILDGIGDALARYAGRDGAFGDAPTTEVRQ